MNIKKFIKNRSKKTWVILAVVLVIVIGVGLIAKNLSSPSEGTIKTVTKTTVKSNGPEASVRLDGKTVSFSRPSRFHLVNESQTLASGEVEKFNFLYASTISQNLSVQVRQLPTGNLNDDSSYHYRKLNSAKFQAETRDVNGNNVVIMSDPSAGFSKVAFLTHNGLVAYVTMISTDNSDQASLQKTLDKVLESWQWL